MKLLWFEHPQILWKTQQKTWFASEEKTKTRRLCKTGDKNNCEHAMKSQLNCFCSSVQAEFLQQQHCQQKCSLCWAVFWCTSHSNGNFLFQNTSSTCASTWRLQNHKKVSVLHSFFKFWFQWSNVLYTFRPCLEQNTSRSKDFIFNLSQINWPGK